MNHISFSYTALMPDSKKRSLKSLLAIHEIAFLVLVAVTGLLSGLSAYFWQETSNESIRINNLVYLTEQIRSEFYRQLQEVMRARMLEETHALSLYKDYSSSIDTHFNQLRQNSATRDEDVVIQALQQSYRELQKDMNFIIRGPANNNFIPQIRLLDPRLSEYMVGKFEQHYGKVKLHLAKEHDELEVTIDRWTKFAPVLIPVLFMLAVILVLLARRILQREFLKPMATVMHGAGEISRGNLQHKIPEQGVAEVVEFAGSINRMANDLVVSRDALVESEKQAALGALIPVVAHNIRNPLASIRATAQVLDSVADTRELNVSKQAIIDTTDRLGRWVNALVSYLHPLKPQLRLTRVSAMLDVTLALLKPRLEEKGILLEKIHWDNDRELNVDPDLMEQALYALLANAIDASSYGEQIVIELGVDGAIFYIKIADNGPGIQFDPEPGNLEPGPSTKHFGTGLGIPIAFKICQRHGWDLRFIKGAERGTEVIISVAVNKSGDKK